jgi:Cu+-exporting ATPase
VVEVRLDLEGMTCAACAGGASERKLNRLSGVEASVNFATEQATVHSGPRTSRSTSS